MLRFFYKQIRYKNIWQFSALSKKEMLFFPILFISSFLFSQEPNAFLHPEKGQLTKISGIVVNPIEQQVGLRFYTDYISLSEELFTIPIGAADTFSMTFQLENATTASFHYANQTIPIFIEPGDDLFLKIKNTSLPKSLSFEGKGAEQNQFYLKFDQKFDQYDEDDLIYEMASSKMLVFRHFMDELREEKKKYLALYNLKKKEKFSVAFNQFITAEIDYWWAYYLLRYRMEHPIANDLKTPMVLSSNYCSFFNEILISNDDALNNRYYLYFIDQYLSFQSEPKPTINVTKDQLLDMEVVVPSMLVFSSPEVPPILEEIKEGSRVKFLGEQSDFTSKLMIKNVLHEDFWYKIRTASGQIGWVNGVGLKKNNNKNTIFNITNKEEQTPYRNAANLLQGKVLFYTIANDLYWRSHVEDPEKLSEEVKTFLAMNPERSYDQIIGQVMTDRKLNLPVVKNSVHGSTNYQLINNPKILSEPNFKNKKEEVTVVSLHEKKPNDSSLEMIDSLVVLQKEKEQLLIEKRTADQKMQQEKVKQILNQDFVEIDIESVKQPSTFSNVKVKIKNYISKETKLVLFAEPVFFEERLFEIEINGDHTFNIDFDLVETTTGYFYYGDQKTPVYLEPGDQFEISFDAKDFANSITFTGKGKEPNNYLKAKSKYFKFLDQELKDKIEQIESNDFLSFMQKQRKSQVDFLNQYNKMHSFSKAFQLYAKADIDYWYAYQLLNYPWEHPLYKDEDVPMKVEEDYYDFLNEIPIDHSEALPNMNYTYFLDQFFDHLAEDVIYEGLSDMQIVEQYLTGNALNYYKTKLYANACKRGKAKVLGLEIKQFIEQCPNETYNNLLRYIYNDAKGLDKGSKAPSFTLMDINGQEVSLNDYLGKIVYIDFWATWCSSCIHHMRNSQQWKYKFKDKDVVFLYVSLDKDKSVWQSYVKGQQLNGVHLVTSGNNVYQSNIAKLYKVKKLPALFLIDKLGKISYNSLKDSGTGRLADHIMNLLKEN